MTLQVREVVMAQALTEDHDIHDRLLPWPKVRDITGLSRTTAWRLQKAGDFPLPVVISRGRVGWRESELQAWAASRAPRGADALPKLERSFAPAEVAREIAPIAQADPRPIRSPSVQNRRKSSTAGEPAAQMTFKF